LPLLLEPPEWEKKQSEAGMQQTQSSAQVPQPQKVVRHTSEPRQACAVAARSRRRAAKAGAVRPNHPRVPTQPTHLQSLTRPSSECPHTSSLPLPEQCRWQARSPHPVGSIGLPRWSYTLAHIPRNSRFRELWRGG
jgi:hypothetical protein